MDTAFRVVIKVTKGAPLRTHKKYNNLSLDNAYTY